MQENHQDKREKLKRLQQLFSDGLDEKIKEIFTLWKRMKSVYPKCVDAEELHRYVHTLAGSSASFGYIKLGKIARDIELKLLEFCGADEQIDVSKLLSIIEALLQELKLTSTKGPDAKEKSELPDILPISNEEKLHTLVYLLEDDNALAKETQLQLTQFGYEVKVFSSGSRLAEGVEKRMPNLFLIDINLPEGKNAGPEIIKQLDKQKLKNIPTVFISGFDGWSNRLQALRAGGQAFITKPTNFHDLVELLDRLTGKKKEDSYRVLIVDDSKDIAEHYAAVLELADMEVMVLQNPFKLLEVLPDFSPDLILMDLYMPVCSGFEAAAIIRQLSAYTNIPIVYLSTETGMSKQLEAMQVGGDDFLQKPINEEHLIAAVSIRAKRFRELSSLMNKDSLTGLLNHINLKQSLEREVAVADRHKDNLSFVMIDIDHFKHINDEYGHPEGDKVIKTLARLLEYRLRKGDISARYGGEEFALILPSTNAEEAVKVVQSLRARFSQMKFEVGEQLYSVTFSSGIATYPGNGEKYQDSQALISAADQALYQAKHAGRNRVVHADQVSQT